jgi:hypothetical protein
MGLTMVDSIRGADFADRFLHLALAAGEPARIARAFALQGGHRASGEPWSRQSTKLLEAAERLAEQTDNAHALAFAKLLAGITQYFQGHWRNTVEFCDQAERMFRGRCTGVAWETSTAHAYSIWGLFWLGELGELSRRVPLLAKEAHLRGNVYAANLLPTAYGVLAWVMREDLDGARLEVRHATTEWEQGSTGFQLQRLLQLIAEGLVDIYAGDGRVAWHRITENWPSIRRSLLFRITILRLSMLHLHALSALAAGSEDTMLQSAERDAHSLAGLKIVGAQPLAYRILAATAARRGNERAAVRLLTKSMTAFEAADMALFAAVARRRLGELLGGDEGREMVKAADAFMASQSIVNPVRMTAMLAPGFGQ